MYVDKSGDPGLFDPNATQGQKPSEHFILSGVVVPSEEWRNYLSALVNIRRALKDTYNLPVRAELHGSELINPRSTDSALGRIKGRHKRVRLYSDFLRLVAAELKKVRIINVYADKAKKMPGAGNDWDTLCWTRLIQRFHTFLQKSKHGAQGLVFSDECNEAKVRKLLRKMRVFNNVPSHFGGSYADPVVTIVEDPIIRNSENSFFVQIADMTAHALYRLEKRKPSLKKYNVDRLFHHVEPLLLKEAGRSDPLGIVRV